MLTYPAIDPVALQLGPLAVHWYGLTSLAAFGLFLLLGRLRLHHAPFASISGPGAWSRKDVEDILFLGVVGVVVGGRLGYCPFYKPGPALGHGVCAQRLAAATPSIDGLPISDGRVAAVHPAVGVRAQRTPPGPGGRSLPVRLRLVPLHRRIFPRTGCSPGLAVAGHEHGAVAVPADDRGGRGAVAVGAQKGSPRSH